MIIKSLAPVLHPSLFGGLAGHEASEASWEAMMEIERALMSSSKLVMASYDYDIATVSLPV